MAEIIKCPECSRPLQVPESYYGQTVQCPECGHQFTADPHAQSVQTTAPPTPPSVDEERPSRRRADYDDDDYDDDDLIDLRPIRHSNVPHRGGMILAIGIIALVIFPYSTIVCGPLAWIMGNSDLGEIRAGRMDPSGEGMVQAGRVLGIISTCLMLGVVFLVCTCFGFAALGRR